MALVGISTLSKVRAIEVIMNIVTRNQEDDVGIWFSNHALDKTNGGLKDTKHIQSLLECYLEH